jgi:hypothetical protein
MNIIEVLRSSLGTPVCPDCAVENGGDWPDHYIGTTSVVPCALCGEEQSCSPVSDYRWPRGLIAAARVPDTDGTSG